MQKCDLPPHTCPPTISEDCLYANVYVPASAKAGAKLPVMFFIPGGRFEQGTIAAGAGEPDALYDGERWAGDSNIILVDIQYRLGAFGFLVTETLEGNYGYLDQVMALEWVQENIASFGGDPDNVMLFGQSAGGTSTSCHLTANGAEDRNLFAKAVIESNPFGLILKPPEMAQKTGKHFGKAVGCKSEDAACLRSKSSAEVLEGQIVAQNKIDYLEFITAFYPWTPCVDGKVFSQQPIEAIEAGNFKKVPVMMGSMYNDALLFIWQAWNHTLPKWEYEALLVDGFHETGFDLMKQYPGTDSGDNRIILAHLVTQWLFTCPARRTATAFSQAGVPTFLYQMHHGLSFDAWGPEFWYCRPGAVEGPYSGAQTTCHGSELPILFFAPDITSMLSPGEVELATDLNNYWASFARYSDPNKAGTVDLDWPSFNTSSNLNMLFATPSSIESDLWKPECDLWDKWGYIYDLSTSDD